MHPVPVATFEGERLQGTLQGWGVVGRQAGGADIVGEHSVGVGVRACDGLDGALPAGLRLVVLRCREVVGDRREGDLRRLEEFHAVRDDARRRSVQVPVAAAIRADVQFVRHRDVVDRIVVPVGRRAAGRAGEHGGIGEVECCRADRPAGPEQVDAGVESAPQSRDVVLVAVAPVLSGADDEARTGGQAREDFTDETHVRLDEAGEGRPIGRVLQVVRDVVEQEPERPDAEPGDGVELGGENSTVLPARVLDREPGREAVDEVETVTAALPDKLGEAGELVAAIGGAPVLAHERVVLRRVDEGVEPSLAEEIDEVEALLVSPRRPVEAFDDAANGEGRVAHCATPRCTNRELSASPPSVLLLE